MKKLEWRITFLEQIAAQESLSLSGNLPDIRNCIKIFTMTIPGSQPTKQQVSTLSAWSGLIGPLVILLGSLITALGYTGLEGQAYNPLNHFVSELGEVGVSQLAAVFNASLIVGGIFNAVFMIILTNGIQGWLRYPLALLGVAASVCGGLVGVFPMNNLDNHLLFALGFFNLGLLVALAYSLVFLLGKNHTFPRWLSIPGFINAAAFFVFNNFPSQIDDGVDFQEGMQGLLSNRPDFIPLAALEWVVVLGIMLWFIMLSIHLIQGSKAEKA